MSQSMNRRAMRAGSAAVAALLAIGLTSCAATSNGATSADGGSSGDGAGSGEKVTIKFAWWGSDSRVASTQQIIDAFEAENPDIHVEPVSTSWDDYFEKMNVMAAGNDLPDVMTQDDRYLTEYASRGLLADLASLDVDTSKVDQSVVDTGKIDDTLYGIATGVNVHAVVADPAVFEQAGVALPDDTTWTWEDYSDIAAQITAATGGSAYGVQNYSFIEPVLAIYARQHGEEIFTKDGAIGVSPETIESWFQRTVDQIASQAEPSAETATEIQAPASTDPCPRPTRVRWPGSGPTSSRPSRRARDAAHAAARTRRLRVRAHRRVPARRHVLRRVRQVGAPRRSGQVRRLHAQLPDGR